MSMWLRVFLCLLAVAIPAPGELWSQTALQVSKAQAILTDWRSADERVRSVPRVVLWTPADREPAAEYRSRVSGVLRQAGDFLNSGIARYGFQGHTLGYEEDPEGWVKIHVARGKKDMVDYSIHDLPEVREDCFRVLRELGIDPAGETVLVFCNSAIWNPEDMTYSEMTPFASNGSHSNGVAWLVDSPILDAAFLSEDGPELNHSVLGRISFREFNRYMLQRVLREMGCAMGLPRHHGGLVGAVGDLPSFMSGDTDGGSPFEDPGLALADALRLISHPLFSGTRKQSKDPFQGRVVDLSVEASARGFLLSGRIESEGPSHAVVGYLVLDDEDGGVVRRSTVAVPDRNGRFILDFEELMAGENAMIEVVVLNVNGAASDFHFKDRQELPCQIGPDGEVNLTLTRAMLALVPFAKALWENDANAVEQMLRDERIAKDPSLSEIARRWVSRKGRGFSVTGGDPVDSLALADLKPKKATTGYGPAFYDRLPGPQPLLVSGHRLFHHGLYAHAPAKHVWDLDRKWGSVAGFAGLADGHPGTVVFEIHGDGKLLWRSPVMREGQLKDFEVGVAGVTVLEFLTTDAGDGKNDDWALWLEPQLGR